MSVKWLCIALLMIGVCGIPAKSSETQLTNQGKCKGLWRSDKLVGKCFGLSSIKAFFTERSSKLRHLLGSIPAPVHTPADCRALCCNIGPECVTWQFQSKRSDMCKIGGPVRLGLEGADTLNWCEPLPPESWSGYRLSRAITGSDISSCNSKKGVAVPHQCFGLGPERMNPVTNKRMSISECEAACCADPKCDIWQAISDRGCFYSKDDGISCGEHAEPAYMGGRKCVPGFCGSAENEKKMLSMINVSSSNKV